LRLADILPRDRGRHPERPRPRRVPGLTPGHTPLNSASGTFPELEFALWRVVPRSKKKPPWQITRITGKGAIHLGEVRSRRCRDGNPEVRYRAEHRSRVAACRVRDGRL